MLLGLAAAAAWPRWPWSSADYRSARIALVPRPRPRTRPDAGYQSAPGAVLAGRRRAVRGRARRRAGRSGATCPTPTTTSSSRSSARSWAWSARFVVLLLFAALAYTGLRIARALRRPVRRSWSRPRSRSGSSARPRSTSAYVVGLLPVTGLPLPLISAGGTSLLVTVSRWACSPRRPARAGGGGTLAHRGRWPSCCGCRRRGCRGTGPAGGSPIGCRAGRRVEPSGAEDGRIGPTVPPTSPRREARRR